VDKGAVTFGSSVNSRIFLMGSKPRIERGKEGRGSCWNGWTVTMFVTVRGFMSALSIVKLYVVLQVRIQSSPRYKNINEFSIC